MDFVLLTPAYDAAATLAATYARIPDSIRSRIRRAVIVDDGSRDGTYEEIQRLATVFPAVLPLRHPVNRGYGEALKTLLRAALAEQAAAAVVLHADGQYAPESLPEMLAPLETGSADLVQGSRLLGGGALAGGMPLYKFLANRGLTAIENAAFGLSLAEYHSGYMGYTRSFLEAVQFAAFSGSFDFDLEMMAAARAGGYRIREIPIPTRYAGEVSHVRSIPYGLRVLGVVARYLGGRYRRRVRPRAAVI